VVVDSFSTDRTEEIACQFEKVRFVKNKFEGHVQQKNYAIDLASHDYVLALDADEELSAKLQEEIISLKNLNQNPKDGYWMPRLNNYCGQWIKHGGWYPDRKIRLWNKQKGYWGGDNPHDKVVLEKGSDLAVLKGDLLHYTISSLEAHIKQINYFSEIAADRLIEKKSKKNAILRLLFDPPFTFFKKYILQLGFLDGFYGYCIAKNSAHAKFLKYAKFYQKQKFVHYLLNIFIFHYYLYIIPVYLY
jgi:glycosyltransferase involved in cell wall biosynthesis